MPSRSLISPEDQSVTFVELFFDIVFVFAVTQITALLHNNLDLTYILQAILIFWLIWWAWQQFTWTLNTIDTTHPYIEFITLVSTAIAFFMAIAIPEAFADRAFLFAITYVSIRLIGLYLQFKVSEALGQSDLVKKWITMSLVGISFVLAGSLFSGVFQYIFWTLAIVFDLLAANSGGRGEWAVNPEHIAERHGLIVIIALGESLIVAAGGLINETLDFDLILVGIVSVALTCGLWWSYFVKSKPILEKSLKNTSGAERAMMVRDAFSLSHFPMIAGIISLALAIEEVIAYPGEPMKLEGAIALAVGLFLFIGGTVLAIWRATGQIMKLRLILISIGSVLIVSRMLPISEMLLGLLFLIGILVIEHVLLPQQNFEEVKIK